MNQILPKIKQNYAIIILIAFIVFSGAFLRVYYFSDWLHFETDQTDDILTVSQAVSDGVENLPLLGPVAAGGPLRIGPASYYIQYLSARIFGNDPAGHATGVLIFSILSLPLFYFFIRRYFSQTLSISLLTIFSFSFYLILYSRFSWNPNLLPFFSLAFGYALLRSLDKEEPHKNRWLVGTAGALAILTQLHFNALFVFPPIALGIFLWRRPKFSWKAWAGAVGIFLLIYSPVIISDIRNQGANTRYFMQKVFGANQEMAEETPQETEQGESELGENLVQTIRYTASNLFLIVTGEDFVNGKKLSGTSWGLTCPSCQEEWPGRLAALLLLAAIPVIILHRFIKENDSRKKDFLLFTLLWFFLAFFFFFFLRQGGLNIYPRFFLIIAPLGLVFLGYFLEKIPFQKNKLFMSLFFLFILFLSFNNLSKIRFHFHQLSTALTIPVLAETEDKFPNTNRITLEQQVAITDHLEARQKENGWPIYLASLHEYEPAFWYHLEKRGIFYHDSLDLDELEDVYAQGNYFFIYQTVTKEKKDFQKELKEYQTQFDIISEKSFGILTVLELKPKSESVTQEKQKSQKITEQKTDIEKIVSWKEFFKK